MGMKIVGLWRRGIAAGFCLAVAGVVLSAVAPAAAGVDLERHEYRRIIMGTQARIVLYAQDDTVAREAAAAAFARMVELDNLLTDYRPSELTRLCEASGGPARAVSPDLMRILQLAEEVSGATGGAFDVTLGPLTQLWREVRKSGERPAPEVLAEARSRTGWRKVERDASRSEVRLAVEGMRLDLGAIGKGYAADRALETLGEHGVTRALVDLGGDLVLGDPPPGRQGWRVAVAGGEPGEEAPVLTLTREAVATSGDTEQYVEIDGQRYSHILDPRTGLGLTESECVTVVAPNGALADALASATSVLRGVEDRSRGLTRIQKILLRFGARVPAEARPADEGWVNLFDGETLEGWTTRGGRYDGNAIWTVEDGDITGRVGPNNAGGLLYTENEYTCFEFECETKIDYPFDSGIFFRMVPPGGGKGIQVTLDYRPNGEVGALYADGFLVHNQRAKDMWKTDEWNHFLVRVTGFDMKVDAWMNGLRITNHEVSTASGDYAPSGLIGVQVHGGRDDPGQHAARFRNVYVRELPVFDVEERRWQSWLDDRGEPKWRAHGPAELYTWENGVLSVSARDGGGWLESVKDYTDFRLRLDFQVPRMGNSGVFLRGARGDSNPTASGCEVQILDDYHWEEVTGTTLKPWQFTGSLYACVPPLDRRALHPLGHWNTYEILCRGSRLAVALNGRILYDVDTFALAPVPAPPFAERAKSGFLGLQAHGSPHADPDEVICFRNVFIQEL